MSRTRNAALGTAFTSAQYLLALVSGFILFPMTIRYLGAYDNGLWLITGELAGYLLLGDLGVFAVLPWLVAAKDGAGDRAGIARNVADALCVGLAVGAGAVTLAAAIRLCDPASLGVNPGDWEKVSGPLAFVIVLGGVGFPLRAFTALLVGLQDVTFLGWVNLSQAAVTVALTATLIPLGFGLPGLAVAVGVPPLLSGLAAAGRAFTRHPETVVAWYRPRWAGCRHLVGQGIGAWLGGLGFRLLTASSSLVFAWLGRPDWATVYAATGKVAQVLQTMCLVIPDGGLVGLSQLHGEGDSARTRRLVMCLLLLYLIVPGAAALAVLAANPWFVRVWLGADLYAGDYVSGLIALNLLVGAAVSGLFKVVAVVGFRLRIGSASVVYGSVAAGLGYLLGRDRGPAGLAEGALLAGGILAVPYGLIALRATHGIGTRELASGIVGRGLLLTAPLLVAAALLGGVFADGPPAVLAAVGVGLAAGYAILLRSVIAEAPWPEGLRKLLLRLRLIPPSAHAGADHQSGTTP